MKLSEATARELRNINPRQEDYLAAVDYLFGLGWRFQPDNSRTDKPVYSWGWWVKSDHPTKCRACGDPGNFHLKAWDTVKLYVAPQ